MMSSITGSKFGNSRRATILKYNNDGTVLISLDEVGLQQISTEFRVPMPLAWSGPDGEFIGGYPSKGTSVIVKQSQGGQWFIESCIPSRGVFNQNLMSALRPGRAVMQVKGGNKLFVDPKTGIQIGNNNQYAHFDPQKEIFSHNFSADMSFTEGARSIDGIIKRDIKENSNRGIIGSTLFSHIYEDSLTRIAMDPSTSTAIKTSGEAVRNPPLIENRELIYEFADSFDVGSDIEEVAKIVDPLSATNKLDNGRKENRNDILSLNLQFPNHLIEIVKGTVVDIFGNILDLNRNIIPIGRLDQLSLKKNVNKDDAYARIRAQSRKSIAYHFEINTRKSGQFEISSGRESVSSIPDVNDTSNYSRSRSKFFIDIDKEGQFKINVPQSSETGNVPLLTRYENYSNLLASQDNSIDPNILVKNVDRQDIFLDSFAKNANIKLKSSDSILDGYESPIDRITSKQIMMGTAYHDITKSCASFLATPTINLYEDNTLKLIEPYEKIVEETIIVSGSNANAGGRSGLFNLEGFAMLNIGANTSDRQSLWADFAGGIVSHVGRDKRGISHAMHLDGDMIIQLGGPGLGNSLDSRFADQNDGARIGTLDIRIIDGNRPMTIIRIDKLGVRVATEGVLQLTGQQGILLSTQGDLQLNGERVGFFTNTNGLQRVIERNGIPI